MKTVKKYWPLNLIAALTALIGIATLSSILFALTDLHRARLVLADARLTVIAGISLIYLAMVIRRGKYNAWLISIVVFALLLIRNFRHFVFDDEITRGYVIEIIFNLVLPLLLLAALIFWRRYFNVRSEASTFRIAVRRTLIILAVTFLYGFLGFQLFDHRDFHQEIGPLSSAHYTLDQFGLTTNNNPVTYTRRAVFFVDSLASISVASLTYVAIAFFAPIRFRLQHRQHEYEQASAIVSRCPRSGEDFFKLWPRDKMYFMNKERTALLAYKVTRGTALCVGDPLGSKTDRRRLFLEFIELCRTNDWRPALIHTDKSDLKFYAEQGLESQKIGEEALVDIDKFTKEVVRGKYFRNINNRFTKAGYRFELAEPPHSDDLIRRLQQISRDWSSAPGRAERGFMMGYFSKEYIQLCKIALLKDSEGRIQAFANQVPTVKEREANFDFLRHFSGSPANINDFLMLKFIAYLQEKGYRWLNMGLSPLAGLDAPHQEDSNLVDNVLKFVYTNGGRFYSFEGLKRFKSKYEPEWEDRYVVYSGGLPGFGRTLNALLKAMTDKV